MKIKVQKNRPVLKIFNDPKRSRILWHDAKIFPSASMIYLENILSGVYGPFSNKLKIALNQLNEADLFHLMLLENDSILNKIQLKAIQARPHQTSIAALLKNLEHFFEPVLRNDHLKLKTSFSTDETIELDERYGMTILQNAFILAYKFKKSESKEILIKINHDSIELEVDTSFTLVQIKRRIAENEIYNEKSQGFSLTSLAFYVNQQLALSAKKFFNFHIKNKKLIITYGQR